MAKGCEWTTVLAAGAIGYPMDEARCSMLRELLAARGGWRPSVKVQ